MSVIVVHRRLMPAIISSFDGYFDIADISIFHGRLTSPSLALFVALSIRHVFRFRRLMRKACADILRSLRRVARAVCRSAMPARQLLLSSADVRYAIFSIPCHAGVFR